MGVKINFRIMTKNHAADSKIGYTRKGDFRAAETHGSHPTAWGYEFLCLLSFKTRFMPAIVTKSGLVGKL